MLLEKLGNSELIYNHKMVIIVSYGLVLWEGDKPWINTGEGKSELPGATECC